MGVSLSVEAAQAQSTRLEIAAREQDWLGSFDVLEVWRSRDTQSGPYEELTSDLYRPARIPKNSADPPALPVVGHLAYLTGKTLSLLLFETEQLDITFLGADPLSFSAAASQITSKSAGRLTSYVTDEGVLVIETRTPGTGASLRVLESEAAPILRLSTEEPECLSYGQDARIPLIGGQEVYSFTDQLGSGLYFYKTRFRSTSPQAVSAFSEAFSVGYVTSIDQKYLAYGQLTLIGIDGAPIKGQQVRIYSPFSGIAFEGFNVAGSDVIKRTDEEGFVEFQLVRGQKVSVAIMGTDLVRDIIVPTDPDIKRFNLLDPAVGEGEDIFVVQVPSLIYAERRTL
jgi:hypothetical protein